MKSDQYQLVFIFFNKTPVVEWAKAMTTKMDLATTKSSTRRKRKKSKRLGPGTNRAFLTGIVITGATRLVSGHERRAQIRLRIWWYQGRVQIRLWQWLRTAPKEKEEKGYSKENGQKRAWRDQKTEEVYKKRLKSFKTLSKAQLPLEKARRKRSKKKKNLRIPSGNGGTRIQRKKESAKKKESNGWA